MDRGGPRVVIELGVALMAAGFMLAPLVSRPWHLYVTLGVLTGGGGVCLGYTGHALFLPNWFVRRRGLALSLAFSGVGGGSVVVLPAVQTLIDGRGWRAACWMLGLAVLLLLAPLNLLTRRRPEDLGVEADGGASPGGRGSRTLRVVDAAWVAVEWTVGRALGTARFWWVAVGYFCGLYCWYAVQIHQTKYLMEVGFSAGAAAWALVLVSLVGIPGQVALGHLSDRIGRESVWTIGSLGFAICFLTLLLLRQSSSSALLYLMVLSQGLLGYGLTSVLGAIPAEIFEGPHYGSVFGTLMLASIAGGAAGPWVTGALHDATGSYTFAFVLAAGCSVLSAVAIWMASPRLVRSVHPSGADRLPGPGGPGESIRREGGVPAARSSD